jgi:S1-C subfamily serine protease
MSNRRVIPLLTLVLALFFFALGGYLAARQSAGADEIAALRAEVETLRRHDALRAAGTAGARGDAVVPLMNDESRASILKDLKRELQTEMGLLPVNLLRERRDSFVELYSYDDRGASSYGTAGYLGNGYFITVKHGVVALGQEGVVNPRRITSVKLAYKGTMLQARLVDAGDAHAEVDPGDWAIVRVKDKIDLPPLTPNLGYAFAFADPIFRLGNDYSKGIILSTGHVGQRTSNQLVTCLTDGHPGVSGGGVLNQQGELVGIPVGRMQGDYRFSFILPLRPEMFRKVAHLN